MMSNYIFILTVFIIFSHNSKSETIEQQSLSSLENHSSWKHINENDEECGESSADRIIGGKNATLGQFPWIARIGYSTGIDNVMVFSCGGALISAIYVVTAAHCVDGLKIAMIRLGEHDTTTEIDCQNGICAEPVQDIRPIKVFCHENYNPRQLINDIALIRLEHKIEYNGWVSPICLPRPQSENPRENSVLEVAGWGYTNANIYFLATVLQTLKVRVVPTSRCEKVYSFRFGNEHLCAGEILNEGSCRGDSGGPLMGVDDKKDGPHYYLEGVVSFGSKQCGKAATPDVYANVRFYLKWILDKIEP